LRRRAWRWRLFKHRGSNLLTDQMTGATTGDKCIGWQWPRNELKKSAGACEGAVDFMAGKFQSFPIERIHLFAENPRHGKITDPDQIIKHLLQDEQVFELAKSIAEKTANPLELIGVVRIDDEDDRGEPTYEVWEGNRRVCAMMLLNDPDKAPSKWRKRFEELSNGVELIETVDGRVFDDHEELRFWMRNIHNGLQGGRGRKDWGPDEQHRDNPTKKNAIAFELLERAEAAGLITATQRKGSLTTLQRYVEKPALRAILQADDSDPANVKFGRSTGVFDKLLAQLIKDLLSKEISSRKNEDHAIAYAETLESNAGVQAATDEDETVDDDGVGPSSGGERGDGGDDDVGDDEGGEPRPKPLTKVKSNRQLAKAIRQSGNEKLANLFHSVTSINAKSHPLLIAIGVWALLETCAKFCGANEDVPFIDFFSKGKMGQMGIAKKKAGTIHDAFVRLAKGGNATKHDAVSADFDFRRIINDMEVVSEVVARALCECEND
jgi:hypothetical protein